MRIDAALLALVTPMMPPRPPVMPMAVVPGCGPGEAETVPAAPPRPACGDPGAVTALAAAGIGTKSALVIGSLYFLRRKRS